MDSPILTKARAAGILLGASELCNAQEAQVQAIQEKLETHHMTVSVIGQFKRGKSTLVNALLEENLLPTGIIPITAAVTLIRYGAPSVSVHFKNGKVQTVLPDALGDFISEPKNPDNRLGVSHVCLTTPSLFLKQGLTFVDTPGVGSVHKHNSQAAYASVRESDAVIFMLSVDSPINEIEIEFLRSAKEYAGKFYFAVNKIDTVEEEEISSYLQYCQNLLSSLMKTNEVRIYPVSAKKHIGLNELKEVLTVDAVSQVQQILEESSRRKLIRILTAALGELDLYWTALKMPQSQFHSRFSRMNVAFSDIQASGQEDAKKLKQKGSLLIDELHLQYQSSAKNFDFTDEIQLTQQVVRLYSQQLASVEALICATSDELAIRINELKQELSDTVTRLFSMDYHYPVIPRVVKDEAPPSDSHRKRVEQFAADILPDALKLSSHSLEAAMQNSYQSLLSQETDALILRFNEETQEICDQLNTTLHSILLYREEDSSVVAHRINDLNQWIKKLKSLREELRLMS